MGSLSKLVKSGIKDAEVKEDNLATGAATTAKIVADSVESSEINDGTVTADDLATNLDLSSKTLTLPTSSFNSQNFNISLLGFKMAVNESLTVFNLVDGIVDEFHDESGTDEGEGSNDLYNATDDYYINSTTPDGSPQTLNSAGFTTTTVTEADTSTTGTNPAYGEGTFGTFTVPACISSVNVSVWGSGGGASARTSDERDGGGGGYAEGTLAVTAGQTLYVSAGEGGGYQSDNTVEEAFLNGGFSQGSGGPATYGAGGGGGLSGVFGADLVPLSGPQYSAPQAYVVSGSGGASSNDRRGGAGGGLTGGAAGPLSDSPTFTTCGSATAGGGGGDQEQGGQGLDAPSANPGTLFAGGEAASPIARYSSGGGGAGFYGGGGGARTTSPATDMAGGGGSSYHGHPQITSGSTEAGDQFSGGGTAISCYQSGTNEGVQGASGEDGFVLIKATATASATTTFIASEAFAASSVPTISRIVIFEENVDTPTLNTDIIASISRDGGSNFTTATLSDSGYVTGSSGQRILTGQATISGQPSGQSMRWKLALANNQVKIHGVSLSWA